MNDGDGAFVRVGDSERAKAADVLRDAVASGRLRLDELDGRLDEALRAKTRSDLHGVLADLVPRGTLAVMLDPDARRPAMGPGYSWDDPLVITAKWANERREGAWEVPPFIEVNPVASHVRLDFSDAIPVSLVIDLVLLGGAGDLVVVVPEGWGVDTSRLTRGLGSVRSRVSERAQPGSPQLMIRGKTSLGSLRVRYPSRLDERRRRRAREKRAR